MRSFGRELPHFGDLAHLCALRVQTRGHLIQKRPRISTYLSESFSAICWIFSETFWLSKYPFSDSLTKKRPVPRPCLSSSYGCASCRLCLLRHRVSSALVPSCPPPFLSSSTGSSHSSRSFCIQGATEVQDLPGPGECACWTFLLTPTPCLTPSCDKERAEAPVHRKKELLFFCEAGRPAKGRRGVFACMEGVPWCHVVDSMAAGSRYKL